MHDIRFIRENPDAFDAALKRRKLTPMAGKILKIDSDRRALQAPVSYTHLTLPTILRV